MKTWKKRSITCILILCMVLTVMPTFAATVTVNRASNPYISTEGVNPGSVNLVDNWCTVDDAGAVRFRFVDRAWFVNALGIESLDQVLQAETAGSSANNVLAGVYAKGTLTTKSGETLYFKDVPVSFVSRGSDNVNVLIFLKRTDINANVYDETYTTKLNAENGEFTAISSSISLTSGTIALLYSKEVRQSFDTQAFPEGTIFVSVSDLTMLPTGVTGWNLQPEDGYPVYRPSAPTGDGYMGVFEVQNTGNYHIYGFRKEINDASGRNSSVLINGVLSKFNGKTYTADIAWGAGAWLWDMPGEGGTTVKLTKGQNLIVQLAKSGYENTGRLAAIALVPAESDFVENYSAATAQQSNLKFATSDFAFLSSLNQKADTEPGEDVDVTVNGVSVTAKAKGAQNAGLAVANGDFYGDYITEATVLDALVAADAEIDVYDTASFANGSLGKPVFVNDAQVFDIDKCYIKAGDTIEVLEGFDATNFEPVSLGTLRETEGSYGNSNQAKVCLNQGRTQSALPFLSNPVAATEATATNLVGCKLNGYFEVAKNLAVVVNGVETVIPAGEKIYLHNANVAALENKTTRYDLDVDGLYAVGNINQTAFDLDGTGEGTACKNKPFMYQLQNPGNYNFNSGYLTNRSSTGKVTVECKEPGSGKYLLKTDASAFIKVIVVTYNAEGTMLSSKSEDVYVTVKEPVLIQVSDNQNAFVWESTPLDGDHSGITSGGTTMKPICQPLVK